LAYRDVVSFADRQALDEAADGGRGAGSLGRRFACERIVSRLGVFVCQPGLLVFGLRDDSVADQLFGSPESGFRLRVCRADALLVIAFGDFLRRDGEKGLAPGYGRSVREFLVRERDDAADGRRYGGLVALRCQNPAACLDHVAERGGLDGQQLEIGTRCLFFRKRDFAGMIVLLFLVVVARVILAGMIVPFRFVIVELGSVVARFGLAGAPLPVRAGVSATRHECCGQYADY